MNRFRKNAGMTAAWQGFLDKQKWDSIESIVGTIPISDDQGESIGFIKGYRTACKRFTDNGVIGPERTRGCQENFPADPGRGSKGGAGA